VNEELRSRLIRLRRDDERREEPRSDGALGVAAVDEELPDWFTTRLARGGQEGVGDARDGLAPGLPAGIEATQGERGAFAFRRTLFEAGHEHGDWKLADVRSAAGAELGWLARDPELAALDPATAVYLDIETTGLSGGAGTIPFLVALGRFDGERFELWQAFLRGPEEEAAALAEVAHRIQRASGVVSFFGKSFDRHRLEDKMRMHRVAPPFAGKPHLDLYHPLARLYRGSFANARLTTLEHELCGVVREHDLPGSLAPAAWFDFLAGRAHRLEAVFRHNALDVLSLPVLAAHLSCARREQRADGQALAGCGRARARALAEQHAKQREHAAALEWTERALTRWGSDEGELWFLHAELLRRLGEHERALEGFLTLARAREIPLAARAWLAAGKLALRLRRTDVLDEALERGPIAAQRASVGRALARCQAEFERLRMRRSALADALSRATC